jgi:hypothetical protein
MSTVGGKLMYSSDVEATLKLTIGVWAYSQSRARSPFYTVAGYKSVYALSDMHHLINKISMDQILNGASIKK